MLQQLDIADIVRREVVSRIAPKHRAEFGQFMTPASIARFMVSLFSKNTQQNCYLLDTGAGVGALSCAFLDCWLEGGFNFKTAELTAYEIDDNLRKHLARHLAGYCHVTTHIIAGDYIKLVTDKGLLNPRYTHAILNPPYKKINSHSAHRLALRRVGIETVNLYSAFVALAVAEVKKGGQIVAIIPRSFCNGPYYRPFRNFIFEQTAICHIHLFESRRNAFKDDNVLQENIIIRLDKGAEQGKVTISTSTDDTFNDLVIHQYSFDQIVQDNQEKFIHIPTSPSQKSINLSSSIRYTLTDIGINVSTGPVVDFRLKEHLRAMPDSSTAPLLYPSHFSGNGTTIWPIKGMKKPNAINFNNDTKKWLYPKGFYCVVRRFSSKEEKRRIVANVVDPRQFGDVSVFGFENHLNLFHENKRGLPERLAHGLTVFLNTTVVDEHFRRFNGHTQVNATDLKLMKYPNRDVLMKLGEWAMQQYGMLSQKQIDVKLGMLTE